MLNQRSVAAARLSNISMISIIKKQAGAALASRVMGGVFSSASLDYAGAFAFVASKGLIIGNRYR
jgi:hypothetical protein